MAASLVALRHLKGEWDFLVNVEVASVYTFFVLSAFLLTLRSLEVLPPRRDGQAAFWGRYALKRFFRVYPLYLLGTLALLGATLVYPALASFLERDHGGFSFVGQASMVRPLRTLFWAIPLEMESYLVIPWIVLLAARWPWPAALACTAVAGLWSLARDPAATLYHPHLLSGALLPVFLAGSASAIIVHRIRVHRGADLPTRWAERVLSAVAGRTSTYLAVLAVMVLLTPEFRSLVPGPGLLGERTYRTMPVLLPAACLCAIIVMGTLTTRPDDALIRVFSTPLLERAGEISYSIYLTHPVAIGVVWAVHTRWEGLPAAVEVGLFALTAYAVASLTFAAVERPVIAFGDRLAHPLAVAAGAR